MRSQVNATRLAVKQFHAFVDKLPHFARNLFWPAVAGHEPEKRRRERVLAVLFYQYNAVFWMHEAPKFIGGNQAANAAPKNHNHFCSHNHPIY